MDEILVGLAGFEPTTFRPPDGRATKLRHSPTPCIHSGFETESKRISATNMAMNPDCFIDARDSLTVSSRTR